MAKGSRRGGRVRDKWRDKQWIIVNAPPAFDRVPLNYIPISDVINAKGRVIENTLYDVLKQDPTQHQTKIFVQIDRINAGMASTIFKGHEYAKEFLRSLIRRGSSMINYVDDYTTSDGYVFRVSATAFSQRRINSAKKHEIRLSMAKLLTEKIPLLSLDEFIKEVTMGKISSEMMDVTKKIAIIRHVGVKKTKLLSSPLEGAETKSDPDGSVAEANSEVSTEANSEVSTEANSEVSTEANSEVSTEANSEVSTKEEVETSSNEGLGKEVDT